MSEPETVEVTVGGETHKAGFREVNGTLMALALARARTSFPFRAQNDGEDDDDYKKYLRSRTNEFNAFLNIIIVQSCIASFDGKPVDWEGRESAMLFPALERAYDDWLNARMVLAKN